ncbi:hypothetical protein GCM10022254_16410 [Actinomadura meridiana]|uniref:Uncharacterized protein n=1 Tax=Actinomadura meridiana TaxID=559626 RepID=A0ABP8BW35_9ACTN
MLQLGAFGIRSFGAAANASRASCEIALLDEDAGAVESEGVGVKADRVGVIQTVREVTHTAVRLRLIACPQPQ